MDASLEGSLTYHIFNRSNRRIPVFVDAEDSEYFKDIIWRYKKKYIFKLYHWVIMSNHYHLLIECEEPEMISKIMAGINKAYSFYYHQGRKTGGYLWQGRFKMQAVQKEEYLRTCGRYIEQNPLKAGMVKRAEEFPYSSARWYCLGERDGITDVSPFYESMGRDDKERKEEYSRFLESYDEESDQYFDQSEEPVGYQKFLDKLAKVKGRFMPRRKGRIRTRI